MDIVPTLLGLQRRIDRQCVELAIELRRLHRNMVRRRARAQMERLESRTFFSVSPTDIETHVDFTIPDPGGSAAVAMDHLGNYVIVWTSQGQDSGDSGIFGQRFRANGVPRGSVFQVNQTSTSNPTQPAIVMDRSGAFTVSWTNSSTGQVYARKFAPSCAPSSNEYVLAANGTEPRPKPKLATDSAEEVITVWQNRRTTSSGDILAHLGSSRGVISAATRSAQGSAIAFIDTSIPDWQMLLAGVHQSAPGDQVVLIDPNSNGIDQITQALAGHTGITAIHLFTHGNAGELQIGNVLLSAADLDTYATTIQSWSRSLAPGADLLLYGCDVAEGSAGQSFVNRIAQLTGTAVAASTSLTGQKRLGGNWTLEYATAPIDTPIAVSPSVQQAWPDLLDSTVVPGSQSTPEDTPLTFSSANGNVISLDSSEDAASLVATNGTFTLASTGGLIFGSGSGTNDTSDTFMGSQAAMNAALNGLVFTPTSEFTGSAALELSASPLGLLGLLLPSESDTVSIAVTPVAHTPTVTAATTNENVQSTSGLVLTPNSLDSSLSGYFEITGITGGSLFESDGTTPITNGQFITFAQGEAGLTFTPTTDSTATGSFDVQASTSNSASGLGGSTVTASIAVAGVPNLTLPLSATTNEDTPLSFSNIAVSDPGNASSTAEVTLDAVNGTITLANTAGVTVTQGSASGGTSVSFTGTFPNLDAALDGVEFSPLLHSSGSATLAVAVSEGSNTTNGSVAITVVQTAHTPSVSSATTTENAQSSSGLVIDPNTLDAGLAGYFEITNITGGTLYQNDGITPINNGDFITFAQGEAGLKFTPSTGSTSTGGFTVQASTSADVTGLGGSPVSANITVLGIPSVTAPSAMVTNEDTPLVFSGSNAISVSDTSSAGNQGTLTVTATDGTFTLADSSGVSITGGSASSSTDVTFAGSLSAIDAALANLQFTPATHFAGAASLEITLSDQGNTASESVAITVNPIAHTPTVTNSQTSLTAQTTSGLVIDPNPIDTSLAGYFQITGITGGTLYQNDGVTPINDGDFITFAEGEAGLKFTPAAGSNPTGSFNVQASSSASVAGLGGSVVSASITVERAATISVESTPVIFTEGNSPVAISPGLTVSEPNGRAVTGATVRLNGYVSSQDVLQFASQNGIVGSWDAINGVLTLSGSATAAEYQSALESVTYLNISQDPSTAFRSAQFAVSDALFTSQSATRSIQVAAVNNPPTIAVPSSVHTVEATPVSFSSSAGNAIVVADVDNDGQNEQLTLSVTSGTLSVAGYAPAAYLSFTAPIAQLNSLLDGLTYTPANGEFGVTTLNVSINDLGHTGSGGAMTATSSIDIYVAPIAHTPSVTDSTTTEGARTTSGLVITPSPIDQALSGYFQITNISGGTLTLGNGSTVISNGDFITFAQGQAGLLFAPTPFSTVDGSFSVQASTSASTAGLGGGVAVATIFVQPLPLTIDKESLTLNSDQPVTLTPAALDVVSPAGASDVVTFTVLSQPAAGQLVVNGQPVAVDGTFTSADLAAGAVQFVPTKGSNSRSDSFRFVATDVAGRSSGTSTFNVVRASDSGIPLSPVQNLTPGGATVPTAPSSGTTTDDTSNTSTATLPTSDSTATPAGGDGGESSGGQSSPASNSATGGSAAAAAVHPAAPSGKGNSQGVVAAAPAVASGIEANQSASASLPHFELNSTQIAGIEKTFDRQSNFWSSLDSLRQSMTSEIAFKAWAGTASFASLGMSLAYFMWLFRAGSLVSSLLSSMPAWNFVDPLPILESMGSRRGGADDDEGLESLVTGKKQG